MTSTGPVPEISYGLSAMELTFAPRKLLADYLAKGWRLLPGHEYDPRDWAILLVMPDCPVAATRAEIASVERKFAKPAHGPVRSNIANAASYRNGLAAAARRSHARAQAEPYRPQVLRRALNVEVTA